jgi:hypothetical protein
MCFLWGTNLILIYEVTRLISVRRDLHSGLFIFLIKTNYFNLKILCSFALCSHSNKTFHPGCARYVWYLTQRSGQTALSCSSQASTNICAMVGLVCCSDVCNRISFKMFAQLWWQFHADKYVSTKQTSFSDISHWLRTQICVVYSFMRNMQTIFDKYWIGTSNIEGKTCLAG